MKSGQLSNRQRCSVLSRSRNEYKNIVAIIVQYYQYTAGEKLWQREGASIIVDNCGLVDLKFKLRNCKGMSRKIQGRIKRRVDQSSRKNDPLSVTSNDKDL